MGIRTFDLLLRSVGVFGVTGVDKLLCFMIVKELQTFVEAIRHLVDKNISKFISDFTKELTPATIIPTNTMKLYSTAVTNTAKLWPIFLGKFAFNPSTLLTHISSFQLRSRKLAKCNSFDDRSPIL